MFVLLLALSLTLVLALPFTSSRYEVNVGDVAPRTIKSPREVAAFVSETLTSERRQRAAASVADVLVYDALAVERQTRRTQSLLENVRQVRESTGARLDERLQRLSALDPVLDGDGGRAVLRLDADGWQRAQQEVQRLLQDSSRTRIGPRQLSLARDELLDRMPPDLSADQKTVVRALALALLQPNLAPGLAETERIRQAVTAGVEPATLSLIRGETIVRDGQVIGLTDLEKLEAAGLLSPQAGWRELAGTAVLVLALSVALGLYLGRSLPDLLHRPRSLLLIGLVIVSTVLLAKLAIPGRPMWAYAFPLAAGPMLIATLLDTTLAVFMAGIVTLPVAYLSGYTPELTTFLPASGLETLEKVTFYFTGSIVGILGVSRARQVHSYFFAGAAVSAASAITLCGFWLLTPDRDLSTLAVAVMAALGNGLLAAALTVGTFVVLGKLFGITTSIQLLELAQPDQPLLRRLLTEAPGTYYHSLLVGNLAERAAEAVDADPLLSRVGAYYHDIGKVANPGFFIENQRTAESPHSPLTPQESASVVVHHVADGLRLAREAGLPAVVQRFIAEHHGTRIAMFFYHQAMEQADDPAEVDRTAFSYPGPQPQSKETAVVMLADSVEAATRSLQHPRPEDIDALVDRIVAERMAEGQLDDSQLTLQDLHRIRATFKEALRGMYHPRIAYPAGTYVSEAAVQASVAAQAAVEAGIAGQSERRTEGERLPLFHLLSGLRSRNREEPREERERP